MTEISSGSISNAAPQTGGVRFAPSPTGRFHVGNLRTAWVSFQFARALALPWVVRFEDIDGPRVLEGARDQQRSDLAALGLVPDVELLQSEFHSRHLQVFEMARRSGAVYACTCSRREVQTALAGLASAPHDGVAPVYSGACRGGGAEALRLGSGLDSGSSSASAGGIAWRFKMPAASGHDDFIVARTDSVDGLSSFVPGYHWACAIDDFDGRYDLIVRSRDLAPALSLQRSLHDWIARAEGKPAYHMRAFHTSLVTSDDGHRLEKRTLGVTRPELVASGWSETQLLRAFAASFDAHLLAPITNEARESAPTLKLGELLPDAERT